MAEQSGFFDAHLIDGEFDRIYLAEHFAKYFASFIGNGIFGGKSNELMVREKETTSMSVRVLSGQAWIDGYWYENDAEHTLNIDVADGILHRIDSVVVRWNRLERIIRLAVKKGEAATNPIAPVVQRDNDYYELKLADIYIKAGTTKITQANITDKRLNTDECGLVIGVVQQLDPDEFGIQLETYISEFIAEHNTWKDATQTEIETWADEFMESYTNWFTQFKSDCNMAVTNLLNENQIRFDNFMNELNEIAADNDLVKVNQDIAGLQDDVSTIYEKASNLEKLSIESGQYPGCFYRIINGNTEWINPPTMPGFEYLTTERWNGNIVYQKTIYAAALPNKTMMSIFVGAYFDEIISITGFAIDSDNNMHYPFPIILNGLTPVAVISFAEGDGGSGSDITINTNDDLSSFVAYITVKYTRKVRE